MRRSTRAERRAAGRRGQGAGRRDDGAPWHDAAMPIDERMQLAEGRPLPRKLFAAMAQQDCGQCGYLCETYSAAIAGGTETKLNLCAPGGKETSRMLKRLLEETPAPAGYTPHAGSCKAPAQPMAPRPAVARCPGRGRLPLRGAAQRHRARRRIRATSCSTSRAAASTTRRATASASFPATIRPLPMPCSPPCARRRFPRGRQELPPGADRGLRAVARRPTCCSS